MPMRQTLTKDDKYPDGVVASFFESHQDDVMVDLAYVHESLHDTDELSSPPDGGNVEDILHDELVPNPQSEFATQKNDLITRCLHDHERLQKLKIFMRIQWLHIFQLFSKYLEGNMDELFASLKDLSHCSSKLYLKVLGSTEYRSELRAVFQVGDLQAPHFTLGAIICNRLYEMFVHHLSERVVVEYQTEVVSLRVGDMPVEGLGKIRYVGGWAIRKELEQARRYVRQNMLSQQPQTRGAVRNAHAKCMLLEENVIVPFAWLKDNTAFPATLEVTEVRQYRESGLVHVTDACFEFFKAVEEKRVQLLNTTRLQNCHDNSDFTDAAIREIKNDAGVQLT